MKKRETNVLRKEINNLIKVNNYSLVKQLKRMKTYKEKMMLLEKSSNINNRISKRKKNGQTGFKEEKMVNEIKEREVKIVEKIDRMKQ